jgi:hypothetical protein
VFDRATKTPIADRLFPRNGRAALSPDGLHYASFEAGELRIYSLPSPGFSRVTGQVAWPWAYTERVSRRRTPPNRFATLRRDSNPDFV